MITEDFVPHVTSHEDGQSRLTVGLGMADRLREWIPNGDGYNSEYAHTLADAAEMIEGALDGRLQTIRQLVDVLHSLGVSGVEAERIWLDENDA